MIHKDVYFYTKLGTIQNFLTVIIDYLSASAAYSFLKRQNFLKNFVKKLQQYCLSFSLSEDMKSAYHIAFTVNPRAM